MPIDFWSTQAMDEKLLDELGLANREELLREFSVDLRYIEGPRYIGPPLQVEPDGIQYDLWGVPRKKTVIAREGWEQSYWEVVEHPLAHCQTAADVDAYDGWPSPDWFDYSVIRQQCAAYGEACVVFEGDRLNRIAQLKPAMYLRGFGQILVDMLLAPEVFQAIVAHLCDFYLEYERRILEAAQGGINLLMTGDDFGTQDGPMISVADWRKYLKPGFAAFIELAHRYDVPVMHHTCGAISELIPDFVGAGLDVLQSLQPGTRGMDYRRIKQEFGRDLAFQGGISVQTTMPRGTPAEVRTQVKRLFEIMKPNGGFIAGTSHNIQADTPVENVLALIEAYHEFGVYG